MEKQTIIVLDFCGQYNQLIARRVRECNVYCELLPFATAAETLRTKNPIGIILTGGPASVFEPDAPRPDPGILELGVPVLGICYGCQLIAELFGGKVSVGPREYGKKQLTTRKGDLTDGLSATSVCWMSHTCYIETLPDGFSVSAKTDTCPVAAM